MEAAVRHARRSCPFLRKTSVNTLREMSTTRSRASSALVDTARKCPVMSKALRQISTTGKCPFASTIDDYSPLSMLAPKPAPAPAARPRSTGFDYEGFCVDQLEKKHKDKSYRYFNNINRLAQRFPTAYTGQGDFVTVWCSNDYLGMSKNDLVVENMKYILFTQSRDRQVWRWCGWH